MCMELVQRPGDILSLKWGAYQEAEKVWHIRQSKRGAVVHVPETVRLQSALVAANRRRCRLLMLWTAPPPARECHECGCC
jgi:integrase